MGWDNFSEWIWLYQFTWKSKPNFNSMNDFLSLISSFSTSSKNKEGDLRQCQSYVQWQIWEHLAVNGAGRTTKYPAQSYVQRQILRAPSRWTVLEGQQSISLSPMFLDFDPGLISLVCAIDFLMYKQTILTLLVLEFHPASARSILCDPTLALLDHDPHHLFAIWINLLNLQFGSWVV